MRGTRRAGPPVIVVEGPAVALAGAVAEARRAGWQVVDGFAGPWRPRVVRTGEVRDASDAAEALVAVLHGEGVIVAGSAVREVLDRLLDDLRHAAVVEHRVLGPAPAPLVGEEARAVLARVAAGATLGEAAHELGLSRRTADRRLAEARRALSVDRTAEAVAKAKQLGWLG